MRQSDLALVMATVALAYASSSCRLIPLGSQYPFPQWTQKPMSNVACEGSHVKDFGGVGLQKPPYTFPL